MVGNFSFFYPGERQEIPQNPISPHPLQKGNYENREKLMRLILPR